MEKIVATMVIEIMGRPAAHVAETLNTIVVKLGAEKGVSLLNKKYHEPKLAENSEEVFVAFAEVEVEFDSLENYLNVLFSYMPSHVEVVSPERMECSNFDLTDLGNKIVQRLHNYDSIAKQILLERKALFDRIEKISPGILKKVEEETKKEAERRVKKREKSRKKEK